LPFLAGLLFEDDVILAPFIFGFSAQVLDDSACRWQIFSVLHAHNYEGYTSHLRE